MIVYDDLLAAQTAIGPQRVKSKDLEVEQHDIAKLQAVAERNNAVAPSLSSLPMLVVYSQMQAATQETRQSQALQQS